MGALAMFFWVSCLVFNYMKACLWDPTGRGKTFPVLAGGPFVSTFQLKTDVPGCEEVPGKLAGSLSQGMIELCRQMQGKHASWRGFGCQEQTLYPMHLHLQPVLHMRQL